MRPFGIVLLVLNLLAGAGFAYLALHDYYGDKGKNNGRQNIAAAGQRHIMLVVGMPLDGGPDTLPARVPPTADNYGDYANTEVPFRIEGPGAVMTTSVSPELLAAYFAAAGNADGNPLAGNTPVASQMAEVKRVFGVIKGLIEKADGSAAKARVAAPFLLLQPETFEERNAVLALIAADNGTELAHLLDIRFHRVSPKLVEAGPIAPDLWAKLPERLKELEAKQKAAADAAAAADKEADGLAGDNPAAAGLKKIEAEAKRAEAGALAAEIALKRLNPPKDEPDRRDRLAHLLVHLDQAAPWQKRVTMVVGLREYVRAVAAQTLRFKVMADRVAGQIAADQDRFSAQYTELRDLAVGRTDAVRQTAQTRARLQEQAQKDQDLVNQRTAHLTDLKAQLTRIKTEVDGLLAKQTQVEQQLFAIQRAIAMTLEDIYRLEDQLADTERAKYAPKKK